MKMIVRRGHRSGVFLFYASDLVYDVSFSLNSVNGNLKDGGYCRRNMIDDVDWYTAPFFITLFKDFYNSVPVGDWDSVNEWFLEINVSTDPDGFFN